MTPILTTLQYIQINQSVDIEVKSWTYESTVKLFNVNYDIPVNLLNTECRKIFSLWVIDYNSPYAIARVLNMLCNINEDHVLLSDIKIIYPIWKHLCKQLDMIKKLWENELKYEPTPEEEEADSSQITKWGYDGTIIKICERFSWTIEYVEKLTFEYILAICSINLHSGLYEKRYSEIMSRKYANR